jgi:hypothetical protein
MPVLRRWCEGALILALAFAGCSDNPAPTCQIADQVELPASPITSTADAHLHRVDPGFVLIAFDEARAQLSFASLSEAGVLGVPTALTVPGHVAGPWYGVTAQSAPGDQLLAVYGITDATTPAAMALWIVTVAAGGTPTAPRPLLDADGAPIVLPARPSATGAQIAMGSSASGRRAVLVWSPAPTGAPRFLLLGADATPIKPTHTLDATAAFTCLSVTPSRQRFGISRVLAPNAPTNERPAWVQAEIDDDGRIYDVFNYQVFTHQMGCPVVSPRPAGYTFAWQTRAGTYFADVENRASGLTYYSNIAKGAVHFGGPDKQPPLACVASAGLDFAVTYDARPPLLERFSRFGIQQGGSLALPAAPRGGPVSSWPRGTDGATFLTYLDQVGGGPIRRFLRVECPSAAPNQM